MSTKTRRSGLISSLAVTLGLVLTGTVAAQPAAASDGYFAPHLVHHASAAEWEQADAGEATAGHDADYGDFSEYQCCAPTWTITADALFLQRSSAANEAILFDNGSEAEVLSTSDLGLGTQAGPRLILLRSLGSGWTLDLEYFGIDGWSATNQAGPGDFLLIGDQSQRGPDVETAALLYASRFRTAEINLRTPGNSWIQPLAGFRWIGLSETYQSSGTAMDAPGSVPYVLRYNTRNNLYGGQLGANLILWDRGGAVTITSLNKAGLYFGDSLNAGSYTTGGSDPYSFHGRGHTQQAAFFGELGLTANWQISEHVAIRGGYQLYWLTGVALAPNQPTSTELVFGTGGINSSGNTFMHGPSAGLQVSW